MFLYQNLFLDLPSRMEVFLCNCHDMFITGIYDTKYITEHVLKFDSTFLEYVYYYLQRKNVDNMRRGEKRHIFLTFPDYKYKIGSQLHQGVDIEYRNMKTKIMEARPDNLEVCRHYGYHGWCADGTDCTKSHNIDLFLDQKREKSLKKKKKRMIIQQKQELEKLSHFNESLVIKEENGEAIEGDVIEDESNNLEIVGKVKSGAHQSGYDAFMTGYVFGTIISSYDVSFRCPFDQALNAKTPGFKELVNKLFLSGKTFPLRVQKTKYDKPSRDCQNKLTLIRDRSKLYTTHVDK
jgi:target of EGR1 protein 1